MVRDILVKGANPGTPFRALPSLGENNKEKGHSSTEERGQGPPAASISCANPNSQRLILSLLAS